MPDVSVVGYLDVPLHVPALPECEQCMILSGNIIKERAGKYANRHQDQPIRHEHLCGGAYAGPPLHGDGAGLAVPSRQAALYP